MKWGPLTFQCACLTWLCKSIASASRSLRMAATLRRHFSERSIFVLYIRCSLELAARHGGYFAPPGGESQALLRFSAQQAHLNGAVYQRCPHQHADPGRWTGQESDWI